MALTLALVVVVLGVVEVGFRSIVPRLSLNAQTIAKAPARAAAIAAHRDGPSVLILGNSMSGDGINAGMLREGLAARGIDALIEHQPADSSVTLDWYYELRNMFVARGAVPDYLVLPVGDGNPLVRTKEPTEDLLFSFLRFSDLPDFFEASGIDGIEERASIVLSKSSALYNFRGRIQKRLLTTLVPGYPELRQLATEVAAARAEARAGGPAPAPITETWIDRIDGLADEHTMEVILVALPTEALEGRLPAADRARAARLGWPVLEPAAGVPFAPEDRPDGMHLTPEARDRFTSLLVEALAEVIAERASKAR